MPQTTEQRQIAGIKGYITAVLKKSGVDVKPLVHQIETVASDILVYRKIRHDLLTSDLTRTETSDRGQDRLRVSPLLASLREQSAIVQKGLDKLGMNLKSKKGTQGPDALADFMEEMNKDE